MDFTKSKVSKDVQLRALKWNLELGEILKLPIIIHRRGADKEMLVLLNEWTSRYQRSDGQPRGIIHCFNGDLDSAKRYLNMDFFISLAAYVGYPEAQYLYPVITSLPLDRLVLETDCPFLPPKQHLGHRNEPAYLQSTLRLLADIRGESPEMIARKTSDNARYLLHLPQNN